MPERYPLRLMLMTRDEGIARFAEAAGVDRLFVDMEILGKAVRQAGRNSIISGHTLDDVRAVRAAAPATELMVRLNPPYAGTPGEVDETIAAGADVLMLPMFREAGEVRAFVRAVDGRARTCLLLETATALARVDQIAAVDGVDEIHVGLNDLHLEFGLDFMFELLAGGLVEHVRDRVRASGRPIRFGFGGGALISAPHPLPPALVLAEHVRLGSEMIILSRTFLEGAECIADLPPGFDLGAEVQAVRGAVAAAVARTPKETLAQQREAQRLVWETAAQIRARRGV